MLHMVRGINIQYYRVDSNLMRSIATLPRQKKEDIFKKRTGSKKKNSGLIHMDRF